MQELLIFDFQFNDEELEQEFHAFFNNNNLLPLFTNEHRAPGIKVSYLDAKSVVNVKKDMRETYYDKRRKKTYTRNRRVNEGASARPLKNFADLISMANDNKMYESAMFRVLYNSTNFKAFMAQVRKISAYIEGQIKDEHKFNTWNIVWYNKELA